MTTEGIERRLGALAIGAATLLAPGSVRAFCRATTASNPPGACGETCATEGIPLYWQVPYTLYAFNQRGFPDLDAATVRRVFARSFDAWNAITCPADAGRVPIGLTIKADNETTGLEAGPKRDEPNQNVIIYYDAETWRAHDLDPAAFALTAVWFDSGDGEILGADMQFNGSRGRFTVCPESGCAAGDVDLENVATHEVGHYLGLAHSDVSGSTMWCAATPGEIEKRSLADDDIAGACAVYPPGYFRAGPRTVRAGCSVAVDGESLPAAVLAPFALILLAARRRRRCADDDSRAPPAS